MTLVSAGQRFGTLGLALVFALALAACDDKESAGDQMEDAAEQAGEAMEDMGEKAGEMMDEAGEKMDDMMDDGSSDSQ